MLLLCDDNCFFLAKRVKVGHRVVFYEVRIISGTNGSSKVTMYRKDLTKNLVLVLQGV